MQNFRSAIGLALFFTQLCLAIPTRAADQVQVQFFCAPNQSNKMLPTTYAATSGVKKYLPLVTWRSNTKKITNQQRCEIASKRFQNAWNKGSFDQLVAGKDQNGAGIICALSYRENKCDRSNSGVAELRYEA